MKSEILIGGGCFWCMEPAFSALNGVELVFPGYAGGTVPYPTKQVVETGATGHIEVVRVVYQPEKISFDLLLNAFFSIHDPTLANEHLGQPGWQHGSALFCSTNEQKEKARNKIKKLERRKSYPRPIETQVRAMTSFWEAEPMDIGYYLTHGHTDQYCVRILRPILRQFAKDYWAYLRIPRYRREDNPFL